MLRNIEKMLPHLRMVARGWAYCVALSCWAVWEIVDNKPPTVLPRDEEASADRVSRTAGQDGVAEKRANLECKLGDGSGSPDERAVAAVLEVLHVISHYFYRNGGISISHFVL